MPPTRGGRPPVFDAPATVRVAARITSAELANVRQVARAQRVTMSAIIRHAVNCFTDDYGARRPFVRPKR